MINIKQTSNIIAAISLNQTSELRQIFNSNDIKIDYQLSNDNSDYVLLLACHHNSIHTLEVVLEIFDQSYKFLDINTRRERLKKLINSQNDRGITALHLACYWGNLDIIKMLDSLGADPKIKACQGISIYHLAVEYDQIIPLFYFKDILDLNIENENGMSPLIYSCEIGSDISAYFLISLGVD